MCIAHPPTPAQDSCKIKTTKTQLPQGSHVSRQCTNSVAGPVADVPPFTGTQSAALLQGSMKCRKRKESVFPPPALGHTCSQTGARGLAYVLYLHSFAPMKMALPETYLSISSFQILIQIETSQNFILVQLHGTSAREKRRQFTTHRAAHARHSMPNKWGNKFLSAVASSHSLSSRKH